MKLTEKDLKAMIKESVNRILEAAGYGNEEPRPAIYVGTYGKYNNGSLGGEWIYLDEFGSREDFLRYCTNELHGDERDVELMFQDWEYIPEGFVGESYISDKLWDFMNLDAPYDVKLAIADHIMNPEEAIETIENGDYRVYYGADNLRDVVYENMEEGVMPNNPQYYFDYERFGRESSFDGPFNNEDESIYAEFGVDEDDDEALGEAIIDQLYGGIERAPKETVMNYMDIDSLARDLDMENTYVSYDGGIIEIY